MVLKTFNVREDVYAKFSRFCKEHGISMSKQIDFFMGYVVEEEPEVRKEYLRRLERIRKGKFIRVKSFSEQYGL